MPQTHYSREEIARRGQEIYEKSIRAQVEDRFKGKIIAIDVETGDYAIEETSLPAAHRLKEKHPNAEIYFLRVGSEAVYSFDGLLSQRLKQ